MPLAEAEARRIVAYRLSVSVFSHASLASTLLRPVPSRLAWTGDPVSTRCLGCLTRPGLPPPCPLGPLYCSPGFLGTVPTYLVPTCIFYLPDTRSTCSPTNTGHISLPPIHLLPPPQLSAVGRLLLFRRKEGGHHCYRHVLIRNREGKVGTRSLVHYSYFLIS